MSKLVADLVVFDEETPEARLVVEIKGPLDTPEQLEAVVGQVRRFMWGSKCYFGLIVTPETTYVLRDEFRSDGPDSIRLTDQLPTERLIGDVGWSPDPVSPDLGLERAVRDWLERLAASRGETLPDDPAVLKAFFPEIVGAIARGRVISFAKVA